MRAQAGIFSMTVDEAQTNPDTMIGTMFVFGTPTQVLFDSRFNRSFVNFIFALHVDQELAPLKNKLVATTPLGEQILHNTIFKGCEVLVEGIVLKANLIPLEMHDFDMILDMDWLSTHRASVDCFTKKIVFRKLGYPEV